MALRRPLEDFDLQRIQSGSSTSFDSLEFLVPFLGSNSAEEWEFHRIHSPQLPPALGNLHKYACNSQKKVYVVLEAFLEFGGEVRITEMRLWQMIADGWTVSGTATSSLRYVGFADIINPTVISLMDEEWAHQLSQNREELGTGVQRVLTITPENSQTWGRNPFIRCGVRVAASLSTADKTVKCVKAYLIKRHDIGRYMLLEFSDNGSGQVNNIREALMRKVETLTDHNLEQKQTARAAGDEWEEVIFLSPQKTPRAKQ